MVLIVRLSIVLNLFLFFNNVVVTGIFLTKKPATPALPAGRLPVAMRHRSAFHKLKIPSSGNFCNVCGPYRIRTDDLLIANEALYQLS